MELKLNAVVEALIFASPEPVSSAALARCVQADGEETPVAADVLDEAVARLNRDYEEQGRAFRIVAEAGGWRFLTRPEFAPWIQRLAPGRKPAQLSAAALETLAIIAYRQPLTKPGVEAIRGVAIDGVLHLLLDRGLVRICGRAALPGRPVLYGTTELFLEHFGMRDLDDLPNAGELRFTPIPAAREPGGAPPAQAWSAGPQENAGSEPVKRRSPVAAARKLTESLENPFPPAQTQPHPDPAPDLDPS